MAPRLIDGLGRSRRDEGLVGASGHREQCREREGEQSERHRSWSSGQESAVESAAPKDVYGLGSRNRVPALEGLPGGMHR